MMAQGDGDDPLMGCATVASLAVIGWSGFAGGQVWPYCLGLGLATLVLGDVRSRTEYGLFSPRFRTRLFAGLMEDLYRIAIWSFLGLIVVVLAERLLNLFLGFIDPWQVAMIELRLFDLTVALEGIASVRNALLGLGAMLLLSILVRSWRPVALVGDARRGMSAALAFLGAVGAFTFVAAETAGRNRDAAVDTLRAAIAEDLDRTAMARRDHAAFRWLAAELALQQSEIANTNAVWRDYFAAQLAECREQERRDGRECDPQARLISAAESRVGVPIGLPPDAGPIWLWDFPNATVHAPPETIGEDHPYVGLADSVRSRRALETLHGRVASAAAEAEAARDTIRELVVEGIASLLGEAGAGLADQVAIVMRNAMATALAWEGEDRVKRWWRSRQLPVRGLFDADPGLIALARMWRYRGPTPRDPAFLVDARPEGLGVEAETADAQPAQMTAAETQAPEQASSLATPGTTTGVPLPSIGGTSSLDSGLVVRIQPVLRPPPQSYHGTTMRGWGR